LAFRGSFGFVAERIAVTSEAFVTRLLHWPTLLARKREVRRRAALREKDKRDD